MNCERKYYLKFIAIIIISINIAIREKTPKALNSNYPDVNNPRKILNRRKCTKNTI